MKTRPLFRLLLLGGVCLAFAALAQAATGAPATAPADKPALPRLVDLGASKCVPCKLMKPILEKLTRDYAGRMEVIFIDVWENRAEGTRHGIRMIPTQIFYAADGKELYRHEGFLSEQAILAKWKELGVQFDGPAAPAASDAEAAKATAPERP